MFLTSSIRRKLCIWFGGVLAMLIVLSVVAIYGLETYQHIVTDLETSIRNAPRKATLISSIGSLYEPFAISANSDAHQDPQKLAEYQYQEFQRLLNQETPTIREYLRKLEALETGPEILQVKKILNERVGKTLLELHSQYPSLRDPQSRAGTARYLVTHLVSLHEFLIQTPDPMESMIPGLFQLRSRLKGTVTTMYLFSGIVIVMFCGLVAFAYYWVYRPIRTLHRGAKRVANGDFSYRIHLDSRDEMSELARVFNQVTSQFEEINRDLDRKVKEKTKALIRSERLAGVGFLAAGVAHEINNPLSAIAMAAESLQMQMMTIFSQCQKEDQELIDQYTSMMQREAFRCQEITEKLLSFARGSEVNRTDTNLSSLVEEVVSMVSHLSRFKDREIEIINQQPHYAEINGSEIKQVVLNLVSNALEAMDSGGRLEIDLIELPDSVDLIFRDNGCGMTPEVQDHLFDPFFTQRKGGGGTGLGLSISHRIVLDHRGTLEASSEGPGKGSTFRVRLPKISPVGEGSIAA